MIDLGLLERAEHGEYMTDGELHALHEQAGQLLLHYPDGPIPSARHAQAIGRILLVIVKSLLARIEELESAQTYGEAGVEREP